MAVYLSHVVKYTIIWKSDGKNLLIHWVKKGTNFLGSPNSMHFAAFSHAMGNWWGKPCISHIIKNTIGCESNGKKALILWEPISQVLHIQWVCRFFPGTNFPGFSYSSSFPAFSHAMGNWWENPYISPMVKYTTGWEYNGKKRPFYGKSMGTIFPGLPYSMGFTDFSNAMGKLMWKLMHFPCDKVYHRMGI